VLQDSYKGFIGREIVDDYVNYADTLFANFGDRVNDWMTFNEPWITCSLQVWLVKYAGSSLRLQLQLTRQDHHKQTMLESVGQAATTPGSVQQFFSVAA